MTGPIRSEPMLLVLHGVRLLGFADTQRIGDRWGFGMATTEEHLLDAEAFGWVRRSEFDGSTGWHLTEAGQCRNEELLAAELDGPVGLRDFVSAVHEGFLPINEVVTRVCTQWQLSDRGGPDSDALLKSLGIVANFLGDMELRLTDALTRFEGYHGRFDRAVIRAQTDPQWVTGVEVDSCHRVWFELHEDLIATLGLRR